MQMQILQQCVQWSLTKPWRGRFTYLCFTFCDTWLYLLYLLLTAQFKGRQVYWLSEGSGIESYPFPQSQFHCWFGARDYFWIGSFNSQKNYSWPGKPGFQSDNISFSGLEPRTACISGWIIVSNSKNNNVVKIKISGSFITYVRLINHS